jgi:hypothetical protein
MVEAQLIEKGQEEKQHGIEVMALYEEEVRSLKVKLEEGSTSLKSIQR